MTKVLEPGEISAATLSGAVTSEPTSVNVPLDLVHGANESHAKSHCRSKKPRGFLSMAALLLTPAALVAVGVAMLTSRGSEVETKLVQLAHERDQARSDAGRAAQKLDDSLAEQRALEKERDQALATAKAAKKSERDVQAVLAFIEDKFLLAVGNPSSWDKNGLGKDATLRDAVEAADAKLTGGFSDRPLVEASIRAILGATYLDLGEAQRAIGQYERALALREAELGADDPATGDCRNQLAVAYRCAGRHDDASHLFDRRPAKSESQIK